MKEPIMIEKQHAGTSMNDKLERGRGTGIFRIQASVTWMKPVQQRGVLHQNLLVPESEVFSIFTKGGHT